MKKLLKNKDNIFLIVGGLVALLFASSIIKHFRNMNFGASVFATGGNAKEQAAGFASRLHRALNPSGYRWFRRVDGTNEDEVTAVFNEMRLSGVGYSAVAGFYQQQYDSNLTTDLEDELSSDHFNKLKL